jgi:hypothetical protein
MIGVKGWGAIAAVSLTCTPQTVIAFYCPRGAVLSRTIGYYDGQKSQCDLKVNQFQKSGVTELKMASDPEPDEFLMSSLNNRRGFMKTATWALVGGAGAVTFSPSSSKADDGGMTSQLFNPDGSLKEGNALGVTGETAMSRQINLSFPNLSDAGQRVTIVDGAGAGSNSSSSGGSFKVSYNLPQKWSEKDYVDPSEGINRRACDQISVTQVKLTEKEAKSKLLEKASTNGVAKVGDDQCISMQCLNS